MKRTQTKLRAKREKARAAELLAAARLSADLRQLVKEYGLISVLSELATKYRVNEGVPLEKNVRNVMACVIAAQVGPVSLVGVGASLRHE